MQADPRATLIRAFLISIPFIISCATPVTFPKQVAVAFCERARECDEDVFETVYDSRKDCVDMATLDVGCFLENCDSFDFEDANECLANLREGSCADLEISGLIACTSAYQDCDVISLAACAVDL